MKYLRKALNKSGVAPLYVIEAILWVISLSINAAILVWISEIFANVHAILMPLAKIIVGCIVTIVINSIIDWVQFHCMHKLYGELLFMYMDKISVADYDMFTKYSPGHLISTLSSLKQITRIPRDTMTVITAALRFIITTIAMILVSDRVIAPIIVVFSITGVITYNIIKTWNRLDKRVDNLRREKVKMTEEMISGFAELRSFDGAMNSHYHAVKMNNNMTVDTLDTRNRYTVYSTIVYLGADTIIMLAIIVIALAKIYDGAMVSPVAVVLVTYAWRLVEPLAQFLEGIGTVSEEASALPNFQKVMNYKNTVSKGNVTFTEFRDRIEFKDVDFSYSTSDNVLSGTSFTIKKGQHVGICGPSGGGKSTIVKLIPKFYDVTAGSITIDGVDIKKYTQDSIRKCMGIVHQDPYIFDASIRDNLTFARKGSKVSAKEIRWACEKAHIYDFIMSLPEGFDTNVGPKGLKLSGGQKQRIALARIFISDPDIIILDEATSALDISTERVIQKAIDDLKDKTVIIVAHRISTIKKCDNIIVIDNHNVVEEGNHTQLMTKNGLYANMVRLAEDENHIEVMNAKELQFIPCTSRKS